jgi:hypothetical protein
VKILKRRFLSKIIILLAVSILALTAFVQIANAALTLENVRVWYWVEDTKIDSVANGDVDGDGDVEVVTGGDFYDGARHVAQLVVWDGATMTPENVQGGFWVGDTVIKSVAIGDVDDDGKTEIVTGGYYNDGTTDVAMLCVWDGATLALENAQAGNWGTYNHVWSVAIGDVDGDRKTEIVTGGYYGDGTRTVAQLIIWDGATLALENFQTWYWTSNTFISGVAVEDVDGDGKTEVVTGGHFWDGSHNNAQLCVWSGATLALEKVVTWLWSDHTGIYSIAVGNVDYDGNVEIVTGGYFYDGTRYNAQLCVWDGATLALEGARSWYWTSDTHINSVAIREIAGDAPDQIVTGGIYWTGFRDVAQLTVWNGATLALVDVQVWYWDLAAGINSVATGDVDGDGWAEIVTGGLYDDLFSLNHAQLVVWA